MLIIGGFLFYQSASAQPKRSRVYYVTVRPAAPVIVRSVAPHKNAIWIPGEWVWQGNQYIYANGYYADLKPGYKRYNEGHWKKARRGYVWVGGRWVR
ncbi:MAG: hypothetical protein WBP45_08215 [Daejeonella sp.]